MSGALLQDGTIKFAGARNPGWVSNLMILNATTSASNDSIKITSSTGSALSPSNPGWITLRSTTSGQLEVFKVEADVTINLTGAHFGRGGGSGTTNDLSNAILRVYGINDAGTLKWGVAYHGGRQSITSSNSSATATSVTTNKAMLVTSTISAQSPCSETFWFRANFDDTGGSSEDLWTVQTGIGNLNIGKADGIWQDYKMLPTGFSSTVNFGAQRWCSVGKTVFINMNMTAQTSNATSFTIQAPVESIYITRGTTTTVTNNSVVATGAGKIQASAGSSTIDLFRDGSSAAWTASGTKGCDFIFQYEANV